MTEKLPVDREAWPLRALLLLVLGALAGLAVYYLMKIGEPWQWTRNPARVGLAAFVSVGSMVFAFSLERLRWTWSVAFALFGGLVVGFITYWNGDPDQWGSGERWHLAASLLAIAVAVPLFQAIRDSGSRRLDERAVHDHAWTNLILWFLAWAFVLLVWLLSWMIGALFDLIGLDFLQRLLGKAWFASILTGGAFGAVVGMLRDRDRVLGLLQRVARTILAVLAPPLAAGLVIFVLALPFTGLEPLWRETKETTPLLLACMLGALVLANVVVGNGPEEEAKLRVLRWAGMALGAVMLPLAIVAAISMGKRIGQYGFTPDRLWATVIVALAVAAAAIYLLALIRGRLGWAGLIRRYNVALAAGICLLALFLALPIVNFGAISTRDQLAMLESGKIAPDRFDWRAMRFDFGPSGVKALERLRDAGKSPEIKALAAGALNQRDRWSMPDPAEGVRERQALAALRILPRPVELPIMLRQKIGGERACATRGLCILLYQPGAASAVLVAPSACLGDDRDDYLGARCEPQVSIYYEKDGQWVDTLPDALQPEAGADKAKMEQARARADRAALDRNQVEIRNVSRRQVFVGGRPAGEVFK